MSWEKIITDDGHNWELDEENQTFRIDGKKMSGPVALAKFIRESFGLNVTPAQAEAIYFRWLENYIPPGTGKSSL
jgi:hypothetical protein